MCRRVCTSLNEAADAECGIFYIRDSFRQKPSGPVPSVFVKTSWTSIGRSALRSASCQREASVEAKPLDRTPVQAFLQLVLRRKPESVKAASIAETVPPGLLFLMRWQFPFQSPVARLPSAP